MTDEQSAMVSTFMEITGSDLNTAKFSMEASAFNLETAVNLHMGMNGGAGGDAFARPTASAGNDFARGGKRSNSDDLERQADFDFDHDLDEEGVRKADQVKRQRLLSTSPKGYLRHDASLPSNLKDSVFFGSDDVGQFKGKAKALNEMFAPPRDLMVNQPLQVVQQMCGEEKWLLVNIQRADEFHCLELNRDVLADETVKEVVRSSFLFWQQMFTEYDATNHMHRKTDAQDFVQKYHVNTYPHISIIDPRTGGMIWKWDEQKSSKAKKAGDTKVLKEHFLERIMDFIGENPQPKGFAGMKRPEAAVKTVSVDSETPRTDSASSSSSNIASVAGARVSSSSDASLSVKEVGGSLASSGSVPRPSRLSEESVKSAKEPTTLRVNIKGQGYHIFTALRFKGGVDNLDEKRLTEGGAIRVKLGLPGTSAKLAVAEDATALELVMFVAKRLRDGARAEVGAGEKEGPSSLQAEPRFELSFGMPTVRLSERAGENEEELNRTTLASLGLCNGDFVRLQRLKPLP